MGIYLAKSSECLRIDAQLTYDAVKQRRSDLLAAVHRYCGCASVCMLPAFVASRLSRLTESQLRCHAPKFFCAGARHEGFRWYRPAAVGSAPRTRPKSSGIRLRVRLK